MGLRYRIHHHDTIDSTNDEARRLASRGEPEGAVAAADSQTAGRGRSGRAWITPPGAAIAMSIVLRPRVSANRTTQIALLGGLAVLEGIRRVVDLPMQIKWPNDVLVRGKKVAGVLAEASFAGDKMEYVVLGIGVNVNDGPPPDSNLEYAATSLATESGSALDRESVMNAILSAFAERYPLLGTPALSALWSNHLAMRGQPVRVIGLAETIVGTLESVTDEGAIVVRFDDGSSRTILAGDVHLRGGPLSPALNNSPSPSKSSM